MKKRRCIYSAVFDQRPHERTIRLTPYAVRYTLKKNTNLVLRKVAGVKRTAVFTPVFASVARQSMNLKLYAYRRTPYVKEQHRLVDAYSGQRKAYCRLLDGLPRRYAPRNDRAPSGSYPLILLLRA